jgi:DNA-directed RNA polymerase subunit RPC12/RpoP
MVRKYKVIQCPNCSAYTYIPFGAHRNSCPRCNFQIAIHELEGTIASTVQEAQKRVREQQYALHGLVPLDTSLHPAKKVLQILRSFQSDYPQWLPIHEIFQRSIEAGLLPKEVQEAIDILAAEGFLEKRDDTIRAVPLN